MTQKTETTTDVSGVTIRVVVETADGVAQKTDAAGSAIEEKISRLEEDADGLREQVAQLQSQVSALSAAVAKASAAPALDSRQVRDQFFAAFPELRWPFRLLSLMRRLPHLLRKLPELPFYGSWFVLYWTSFRWLERAKGWSPANLGSIRGRETECLLPEPVTTGSGPVQAAYQHYLRSISEEQAAEGLAVNWRERDTSDDAIEADLAHAVEVGLYYVEHLPGGPSSLNGKTVLEVGPGINYGTAMMLACYGARVTVIDRFLPTWDDFYHPRFYSRLRDWIGANLPGVDVSPLDKLLAHGWHCLEVIGSLPGALEDLSSLPEGGMDVVLSNAVFEHLFDPKAAVKSLAHVSRPGALGLHQVDFRDHRGFDRPLEFLLMSDDDFAQEFEERHGECGNRCRPSEMNALFEESGFRVIKFESTIFAENCYLGEFIPRLRAAEQSKYRDIRAGELRVVSGLFTIQFGQSSSGSEDDFAEPQTIDETTVRIERVMSHAVQPLPISEQALREALRQIVELGIDSHYVATLARYIPIEGSVLDVGCGACWYAPFLLAEGATSYHGVDRAPDFSSRALPSYLGGEMPLTIGEFLGCFPAIHYETCDILEFNPGTKFDIAVLSTVSEHLEDPDQAFRKISELVKPGGQVYVSHGNFYSWSGHHGIPQTVAQYNPGIVAMRQLADWNHILNRHLLDTKELWLNCIRIRDLLDILDKYFVIETVDKLYSPPERGGGRMTPEIRSKLLKYDDDELLVEMFMIVCRKTGSRDEPVELGDTILIAADTPLSRQRKCYVVPLPLGLNPSEFQLYEDDLKLGPSGSRHDDIRELGEGRYSIWPPYIYLSTSDDTDPAANGRRYSLRRVPKPRRLRAAQRIAP